MKTSKDLPPKGRTKLTRHFRKNMSESENIIWSYLRNRSMGVKFRRQVPVGKYVVDFLSIEIILVLELDGYQHSYIEQSKKDYEKDKFLKKEGYQILRIWSGDVVSNREGCCEIIYNRIMELKAG